MRARRRLHEPRGWSWTDWRVLYAVGLIASAILTGLTAGWSHASTALLLAWLGLTATHGVLIGLRAATEGSFRWLRCSWGLCSLLVLGIFSEHEDAELLALFVPLGSMVLWLFLVAGWFVFLCRLALYALQRSAPYEWTWPRGKVTRAALRATILLCVALLLLHLWPGVVHGMLAAPAYALTLGSLALTWAWVSLEPRWAGRLRASGAVPQPESKRTAFVVISGLALVFATSALLWFGTLRRGAFLLWKEQFDALARAAIDSTTAEPNSRGEWIGPWHVDAIAADPRGGVYLRTWEGFDFVDTLSYGFAFRPNQEGSPFGAARYWIHPLTGDWWVFSASNDW